MLEYTQIFSMLMGIILMCLSGHSWSSSILYWAVSKDRAQIPFNVYVSLLGFLLGLSLCIIPNLGSTLNQNANKKETVKELPVYILFLDIMVIKDEHLHINTIEALTILNNFLEKTNTKIVITSKNRINPTTQTNWPIETLRALCKIQGIKGTIIGATPYIKPNSTRQEEINLWHNITKIKYDSCVILDKTDSSVNNLKCTIKVKTLLNNRHILTIMNKLEADHSLDMFKEKVQTYDEQFKTRFG